MANHSLKVEFCIFCDALRREDNGKLIAIGIYLNDIQVSGTPPIHVDLGAFVGVQVPAGEHRVEFRVLVDGKVNGEGPFDVEAPAPALTPVFLPIRFDPTTANRIFVERKVGQAWKEVSSIPVFYTAS